MTSYGLNLYTMASAYDFTKKAVMLADGIGTAWLYGEWTEDKLRQYEIMKRIPIISEYMDYKLDLRADREYMKRYGLTYADIHDPRKLKETSSGSAFFGATLNFVSDNIKRLYR